MYTNYIYVTKDGFNTASSIVYTVGGSDGWFISAIIYPIIASIQSENKFKFKLTMFDIGDCKYIVVF